MCKQTSAGRKASVGYLPYPTLTLTRVAAMGELYKRALNPVRHLMLHLPEVRNGWRLFARFRAHMRALVDKARSLQPRGLGLDGTGWCRLSKSCSRCHATGFVTVLGSTCRRSALSGARVCVCVAICPRSLSRHAYGPGERNRAGCFWTRSIQWASRALLGFCLWLACDGSCYDVCLSQLYQRRVSSAFGRIATLL